MRNKLIFIAINFYLLQYVCDLSAGNPVNEKILPLPYTGSLNPGEDVDAENRTDALEPTAVTETAVESGNTEQLSPSLKGLAAMVAANLPENLRLVKVIEATREVVAGFRYDVTVEVTEPGDEQRAYPCRLTILERPWVVTEWGGRERSLLSTNCSNNGAANPALAGSIDSTNAENNELLSRPPVAEQEGAPIGLRPAQAPQVEPNYDSIADSGQVEELLEQYTDKERKVASPTVDAGNNQEQQQVQEQVVQQQAVQQVAQDKPQKHFMTKVEALIGLKKWLDDVRIVDRVETENPHIFQTTLNPMVYMQQPVNYHQPQDQEQDIVVVREQESDVQEHERQTPLSVLALDDAQNQMQSDEPIVLTPRGAPAAVDSDDSYVQELMEHALSLLATAEGAEGRVNVHKTTDCTKQVVEGSLVKCTLHLNGLGVDEEHECEVQVWDRPWLDNARKTDVTCTKIHENGVRGSEKKYEFKPEDNVEYHVVGGPSEVSSDSEYIRELMNDAFTKLAAVEGAGEELLKLHKVTDCTTQVVAGKLVKCTIHLDGLIGNEKYECKVKVWDRPWLKDARETTVDCSIIHEDGTKTADVKKYEFKPEKRVERQIVGGPSEADSDDAFIQELMNDAFTKLVASEGAGEGVKLHKITDCTTQVVEGSLVRCTLHLEGLVENEKHECKVEVWERVWLKDARETEVDCSKIHEDGTKTANVKKYEFKPVKRVERQVLGGPSAASSDSPYIQQLMQDTLAQLVTAQGAEGDKIKLVKITDCTTKVVAGSLIICTIHLEGLVEDEKHECRVQIWERTWLKNARETTVDCSKVHEDGTKTDNVKKFEFKPEKRVERGIPGGPSEADSDDAFIQELMNDAFTKLVESEGAGEGVKLHKITDCTTQVVAGSLVRCTLHIHELKPDEKHECKVKVWDRPWLKDARETDVECSKVGDDGTKGTPKTYEFRAKTRSKRFSQETNGLSHEDLKIWRLFAKFTQKHSKRYNVNEARYRFGVFKENLKRIEKLNRGELGTARYGVTQFSDLTPEEFRSRHTGLRPRPSQADNEVPHASATIPTDITLPESFDWRDHGAVAKVKDQGSCGSCWAFSVTGNIEGLDAIRSGRLQEYSEQELVDCDTIDNGCGGGLPDDAYKAIEQLGGLETEADYPYEGRKERCHFDKSITKVQVSGAVDLPHNETAIALWLVKNGPISIGINANAMQFYRGGVSHPWKILCKHDSLDHGVLIVGYGVHTYPKFNKTMPYWIIKNSWGPRWGEQGYYRVYRGDGTCGVDQMATSAVLENPN